jgi:hypothetical protein
VPPALQAARLTQPSAIASNFWSVAFFFIEGLLQQSSAIVAIELPSPRDKGLTLKLAVSFHSTTRPPHARNHGPSDSFLDKQGGV